MPKDHVLLSVKIEAAQRRKIEAMATDLGSDMSTVVRGMIDAVELKKVFVIRPADKPVVNVQL